MALPSAVDVRSNTYYKKHVKFDWNPPKSEWTLAERGFGFDFAALIFEGDTIEVADNRHDYPETRTVAIGETDGVVVAVVYTMRGDVHWIISARRASRKERRQWHAR